ncbi:MAG TPA: hypothetical protein VF981_09050 [Gemmatimonadaceae bacterium]
MPHSTRVPIAPGGFGLWEPPRGTRNSDVSPDSRDAVTALLERMGLKRSRFSDVALVTDRGWMPTFAPHLANG